MQVNFSDTYRHRGLRQWMVESIRRKGINDPRVLNALEKVPRHLFAFDTAFTQRAYEDGAGGARRASPRVRAVRAGGAAGRSRDQVRRTSIS